jgi:uncharacterized membrane protein YqaE (UPF0057 family)
MARFFCIPLKNYFNMKSIFTRLLLVLFCASLFFTDAVAAVSAPVLPPSGTEPGAATVKSALSEFRSLSRKERRVRLREARKAIKTYMAERRAGKEPVTGKFLQVLFAILIPPLGVYLHDGAINKHFWIDLLLTLLFYVPGLIYALVIVLRD